MLFLDGDYYTCAEIMKDKKVTKKMCAEFNCNDNDSSVLSELHRHCDKSRFIGGVLIFIFLVLLLLLYSLHRCTWCNMKNYYYKNEYDSMRGRLKEDLMMKALYDKADAEERKDVNNKSKRFPSHPESVSETQPNNNGAELTYAPLTSGTDAFSQELQETPQRCSSSNAKSKKQLAPLSKVHKGTTVSSEDTKV
ncbi:uncharacterized protein LOC144695358 isoform X2 [Cetorhinus maximus]